MTYNNNIRPMSSNKFTHSGSMLSLSRMFVYCLVDILHALMSFSRISSFEAVLDNTSSSTSVKMIGANDRHIGIYSVFGDGHDVVGLR